MQARIAFRHLAMAVTACLVGAVALQAHGQTRRGASVNITPKRVTLDNSRRSATVFAFNEGDEAGTFDIGLVDRVMLPDGQIVPVESAAAKPEQKPYADRLMSARDLVIVTPRHVVLAPHQGQTIRLKLADLPASGAEFRSHLTISTLPASSVGTSAEQAAAGAANQFTITVNSVYGLSMPVVVRSGTPDVRAAIQNVHVDVVDMRLNPSLPVLPTAVASFDLVRQGPNSLFGDIAIRLSSQKPSDPPVGVALSMGVYPELSLRHVQLPLNRRPAPGEHIVVTFTDQDTAPGKLLATATD